MKRRLKCKQCLINGQLRYFIDSQALSQHTSRMHEKPNYTTDKQSLEKVE